MASHPPSEQEPPQADPAADNSEFSQAFKERAAGESPPPAASEDATKPEPEQTGETQGADDTAPAAAGDQPAAQPGSDVDPWAGLNPAQKAYFERLHHSEQSQRGRVAALTRKQQSTAAAPEPAPKQELSKPVEIEAPASADDLDAKIRRAVEEYPDAVGPLAEALADIRAQMGRMATTVQPIVEQSDEAAMTEQIKKLEEKHPDFREIGADESWNAWLSDQPNEVQALGTSFDARDVSLAITLFKAERKAGISAAKPVPSADTTNTNGAKRERQLDASRQVPGKGAPAAGGVPDDFSSAFHARVEQQKREAAR